MMTTENRVAPANSSFQSNVILIKDNDTFEEIIETNIELDFVQPNPKLSLSYSSSIENLSSSSESGGNNSQDESNN